MTLKESEREINENKNKKKNLQKVVAHQDYENIAEQLTKYTNAYMRHLNERRKLK